MKDAVVFQGADLRIQLGIHGGFQRSGNLRIVIRLKKAAAFICLQGIGQAAAQFVLRRGAQGLFDQQLCGVPRRCVPFIRQHVVFMHRIGGETRHGHKRKGDSGKAAAERPLPLPLFQVVEVHIQHAGCDAQLFRFQLFFQIAAQVRGQGLRFLPAQFGVRAGELRGITVRGFAGDQDGNDPVPPSEGDEIINLPEAPFRLQQVRRANDDQPFAFPQRFFDAGTQVVRQGQFILVTKTAVQLFPAGPFPDISGNAVRFERTLNGLRRGDIRREMAIADERAVRIVHFFRILTHAGRLLPVIHLSVRNSGYIFLAYALHRNGGQPSRRAKAARAPVSFSMFSGEATVSLTVWIRPV